MKPLSYTVKKTEKSRSFATDPETFMETSWYCQQAFHYYKLPPHNRQSTCHWILCQDVILRSIVRKFPECVMLFSTFTIFRHVAITLNSNERQTSLTLANLDRLLCFFITQKWRQQQWVFPFKPAHFTASFIASRWLQQYFSFLLIVPMHHNRIMSKRSPCNLCKPLEEVFFRCLFLL